MINRIIPTTGEKLPVMGLGTWKVLDVEPNEKTEQLTGVLQAMRQAGGTLIDTSPMYNRSEARIGDLTADMPEKDEFFYATKVWIEGREAGIAQMEESMRRMRRRQIDLMQIHNLLDLDTHTNTLRRWKEEGKIRYTGITHYKSDHHEELERVLSGGAYDFVQFNYSLFDRHAEKRLLSFCRERGVATLINRPLGEGKHLQATRGKALPDWAAEYGIESLPDLFLRYVISHPDVTCVIPATSNPEHAARNYAAGNKPLLPPEALKLAAKWADENS